MSHCVECYEMTGLELYKGRLYCQAHILGAKAEKGIEA